MSLPDANPPTRPARQRPNWLRILRMILRFIVGIGVVIYALLDELFFPLVRPLINWLSSLRFFELIGQGIRLLPPYGVLILLAVPFIAIEPLKIFALYWTALGHIWQGPLILIIAQILSLLILDRIYHAGRPKLMQIAWFKVLMVWVVKVRDNGLNWVKATPVWRVGKRVARNMRRRIILLFRPEAPGA